MTVTEERRVEALVAELAAERDLALVFVRTKRGADRLVKRLDLHGVRAVAIHANKSQRQREQRARRSSRPARSTRSSRPTSRRADSTSTASRT